MVWSATRLRSTATEIKCAEKYLHGSSLAWDRQADYFSYVDRYIDQWMDVSTRVAREISDVASSLAMKPQEVIENPDYRDLALLKAFPQKRFAEDFHALLRQHTIRLFEFVNSPELAENGGSSKISSSLQRVVLPSIDGLVLYIRKSAEYERSENNRTYGCVQGLPF